MELSLLGRHVLEQTTSCLLTVMHDPLMMWRDQPDDVRNNPVLYRRQGGQNDLVETGENVKIYRVEKEMLFMPDYSKTLSRSVHRLSSISLP